MLANPPVLTKVTGYASGNTTIVNANTYTDATGASVSLTPGVWMVDWKMLFQVIVSTSQSYQFTGRLTDGTTHYDEAEIDMTPTTNHTGFGDSISGAVIVTLTTTTALKLQGASLRGSSATQISRNPAVNSSSTNTVTGIVATKIG